MDLLKFMSQEEMPKSKPTMKELDEWNKLSVEQAYKLVRKNIIVAIDRMSRFTGMCSNKMSEKNIDDLAIGLSTDLSKVGFDVNKVIQYIENKK